MCPVQILRCKNVEESRNLSPGINITNTSPYQTEFWVSLCVWNLFAFKNNTAYKYTVDISYVFMICRNCFDSHFSLKSHYINKNFRIFFTVLRILLKIIFCRTLTRIYFLQ
jgi:hypothetical protein